MAGEVTGLLTIIDMGGGGLVDIIAEFFFYNNQLNQNFSYYVGLPDNFSSLSAD